MCLLQEADIAVALFSQTHGRTAVADPSSPVWYNQFVLVFKHDISDTLEDKQWLFYLHPFDLSIYLLITGCLLSVLLLLLLLEKFERGVTRFGAKKTNEKKDVIATAAAVMFERVVENFEMLITGLLSKREYNVCFVFFFF